MAVTETLEFAVLGPLEARAGGHAIPLGSPKQRALLALFLLHANEPLSRDRLIDELWGESPPATANSAFHVYLSRLRKLLGERLERDADGYRLRLDDEQLDLTRFHELARAGREALHDDPEHAAGLLHEATGLWRGSPFAGINEPFASTASARLEEQYLAALEDRIDADLALGRHHSLTAELDSLVAEHPFRERFRAQQMLALYRSGRQADALAAYQHARETLGDELGLDPSPELNALQQAILRHDADLAAPSAPAGTHAVRSPSSRRLPVVLIVAGGLAVTAVVVFFVVRGSSSAPAVRISPDAVGMFDLRSGRATGDIELGSAPSGVAAGLGSIWVSDVDGRSVSRIDVAKRVSVQTIVVGNGPAAVAVGAGFVWVANGLDSTVSKIDPETNTVVQTITVGNAPTAIAVGPKGVWVANSRDGTVTELARGTGDVMRTVAVGQSADGVAVADGSVWVTSVPAGTVTQIDEKSGRVGRAISTGSGASAVTAGGGAVWVANGFDGTVSRVDPATGTVRATIDVGNGPDGVAVAGTSVWVTNELGGTLTRIDATRNAVVRTVETANRPQGLAVDSGGLFVAVRGSGAGHRGGTLRVLATAGYLFSVDPALSYLAGPALTLMTNDGLTAFRRVGGTAGTTVVPDLAVALPSPTDGGRSYTFKVRRGIHYSNGALVRPDDFRHAIERSLLLIDKGAFYAPYFARIVGARTCMARPKLGCHLTQGIVTDSAANTVTFHLTAPDPDFLYKLALPAAQAVPVATPLQPHGFVPATGPYMFASFDANRGVRLIRNPRFREWSTTAQPDGFPDVIVDRFTGSADAHVATVLRGEADISSDQALPSPKLLASLRTQHSSQLRINPWTNTYELVLNTRLPPFDDVRVRRALNYAVDRARMSDLTLGNGLGRVTCQVLPPNIVGYRRYCPYTVGAGSTGAWAAPDVPRARRLVRASGTAGQKVTLWIPNWIHFDAAVGRYVVSVLNQLGYRAQFRFAPDPYSYEDEFHIQIGFSAWVPDFTTPAGVFDAAFTCESYNPVNSLNQNFTEFCDPAVDRTIARAESLQTSDPVTSSRLWTQVDRAITDAAPWVSFANGIVLETISKRVGNYQYNPQWGTLLDQLWVK